MLLIFSFKVVKHLILGGKKNRSMKMCRMTETTSYMQLVSPQLYLALEKNTKYNA